MLIRGLLNKYPNGRPCSCSQAGTKDLATRGVDLKRELIYTWIAIGITLLATFFFYKDIIAMLRGNLISRSWSLLTQDVLFAIVFGVIIYGNIVYQLARVGYLYRLRLHLGCATNETENLSLWEKAPPPVTILIPSYKEEPHIVRQALFSSALQDYPFRRVVLLIDDPPKPTNPKDLSRLIAARNIPGELQKLFDAESPKYRDALAQFLVRWKNRLDIQKELGALSQLYGEAANWFLHQAEQYPVLDHTDELFVSLTFKQREKMLRDEAQNLPRAAALEGNDALNLVHNGYRHLVSLFEVELTSFERKQYCNLSWTSNKAMNLNSYIGLMGKRFNQIERQNGTYLEQTGSDNAELVVPDASYIVTLDADSLLAADYIKRLVRVMETPGNERVAVAQTPYTAVPGPKGLLERIAGATTDLQYVAHQGFTQADASFWVGANALLRKEALDDIVIYTQERGFTIAKYIQDRTVIEDTESSIDLIVRGWSLYNYPERLSYSATPADFGSLLIQRRRWANGGLIILPKLMRHLVRTPHRLHTWIEGFMRGNYLVSIAGTNIGLLLILTFQTEAYIRNIWLPLTALPYYYCYGRDLSLAGYRALDLFRVYALNLLLIPVNLDGVFKSVQQAVTGKQIPFSRTPKVRHRTAVPSGYILFGYGLTLYCFILGLLDLWCQRWLHAVFAELTTFFFIYAISVFIGFRASWRDLSYALRIRLAQNQEHVPSYSLRLEFLEDVASSDSLYGFKPALFLEPVLKTSTSRGSSLRGSQEIEAS